MNNIYFFVIVIIGFIVNLTVPILAIIKLSLHLEHRITTIEVELKNISKDINNMYKIYKIGDKNAIN